MNKKIILVIILAVLIIVAGVFAYKKFADKEQLLGKLDETVCTKEYVPVCGIDGITYSNKCMAGNTEVAYEGECNGAAGGTYPVGEVPSGLSDEDLAAS